MYAHDVGYQEIVINKVPCISVTFEHDRQQPTRVQHHLSRIRLIPLKRLFVTLVDRSKVFDEGFDEETVLLKIWGMNSKGRRVLPEELEVLPIETLPEEQLLRYHRSRKHRGECKIPLPEPAVRGR